MGNPSKQKGTAFENHVLDTYLRRVWPKAERSPLKGGLDFGDYTGVGNYLVEAKKTKTWRIPEWVRTIRKKIGSQSPTSPWVLVFAGDKRQEPKVDLVVLPAEQYFEQLRRLVLLNEKYYDG